MENLIGFLERDTELQREKVKRHLTPISEPVNLEITRADEAVVTSDDLIRLIRKDRIRFAAKLFQTIRSKQNLELEIMCECT